MGKAEWLSPYTDAVIESLPKSGIKKLDVICPGFSADCLETLEEVDMRYRELFLSSGGKEFHYIPALNDDELCIELMAALCENRHPAV